MAAEVRFKEELPKPDNACRQWDGWQRDAVAGVLTTIGAGNRTGD